MSLVVAGLADAVESVLVRGLDGGVDTTVCWAGTSVEVNMADVGITAIQRRAIAVRHARVVGSGGPIGADSGYANLEQHAGADQDGGIALYRCLAASCHGAGADPLAAVPGPWFSARLIRLVVSQTRQR